MKDKNESIYTIDNNDGSFSKKETNFLDNEQIMDPITTSVPEDPPVINEELQKLYAITFMQNSHQTIYAFVVDKNNNYTGEYHTTSFFAKLGTKLKFAVVPDKESDEKYWIHIIQSDNQLISVSANQSNLHDWRAGILVSYPTDDKEYKNYPELKVSSNKYDYIVVTQNIRVFSTLAIDEYNDTDFHVLTITSQKNEKVTAVINSTLYVDGQYVIPNNTSISIKVTPDPGYKAGNIIINNKSIGKTSATISVTEAMNITCEYATVQDNILDTITMTPYLFINKSAKYGLIYSSIGLSEGTDESNLSDKTIHTYKKENLNGSFLNMYSDYKDEYVVRSIGTTDTLNNDNQLYYGFDNNYKSQSINKIDKYINGLDSIQYFIGYHKLLTNSSISNTLINIRKGTTITDKAYLRFLGFGRFEDTNKWYWLMGLYTLSKSNKNIFDDFDLTKASIYFYNEKDTIIGNVIGFNYYKSCFDRSSSNDTIYILFHESSKKELDDMSLFILDNLNKTVKMNIGLYTTNS